jgi:hypothetical protein
MIRIITLIFLLINYQAITNQTPISKEIRLLLLVFLADLAIRMEPDFMAALFGKSFLLSISIGVLLTQVVLFSICYLKNQRKIFVNHYIFLTFLWIVAGSAIAVTLTQIQIFEVLQLLSCGGAAVFGILNLQYKKQQQ